MKHIYLIRHGQTLFNKQKKIQGFCDSPLTPLGIAQAEVAKSYLNQQQIIFDEAHVSTSERAIDTLKILTSIPYTCHKNLREWNFGDLEAEGEHLNPPLPYRDFFVQFGGEDEDAFQQRITHAIESIATTSQASNILIVSHGAAIAQFYRKWESYSEVKRTTRITNCSILKYAVLENHFELLSIMNHDFSEITA